MDTCCYAEWYIPLLIFTLPTQPHFTCSGVICSLLELPSSHDRSIMAFLWLFASQRWQSSPSWFILQSIAHTQRQALVKSNRVYQRLTFCYICTLTTWYDTYYRVSSDYIFFPTSGGSGIVHKLNYGWGSCCPSMHSLQYLLYICFGSWEDGSNWNGWEYLDLYLHLFACAFYPWTHS